MIANEAFASQLSVVRLRCTRIRRCARAPGRRQRVMGVARSEPNNTRVSKPNRRLVVVAGALVALLVIAVVPTLGADDASPAPAPASSGKTDKPGNGKRPKEAGIAVTVTGTVNAGKDEKGRPTYTLTAGGTTWTLSAGPSWFAGANDALKKVAGKSVEINGTHAPDSIELDVESIDGVAVRAAGKPAWAGGPWVVGASHPGWKDWMADGKPGKGLGREKAPGQNKDASGD